MDPLRPQTSLEKAIEAANEFKRFLDVQPAGSLFNPCGKGEVVDTAVYAHAAALLEQAIAQCLNGSERPAVVHRLAFPVIDAVTNHGSNGSAQVFGLLAQISGSIAKLGLQLLDQGSGRIKDGSLLELRLSFIGEKNLPVKHIEKGNEIGHGLAGEKIGDPALCHADSQWVKTAPCKEAF